MSDGQLEFRSNLNAHVSAHILKGDLPSDVHTTQVYFLELVLVCYDAVATDAQIPSVSSLAHATIQLTNGLHSEH